MLTPEQRAQIARENGAKSRGPKTEAGKARSSQNALKSGEYAQSLCHPTLLFNEDPALLESLTRELLEIYQPANQLALSVVRQITATRWQIERLSRILSIQWNLALIDAANTPSEYVPELAEIDALNRSTQTLFTGKALVQRLNRQIDQLELRIARLERRLVFIHKNFPNVAAEPVENVEEQTQQPVENKEPVRKNEPVIYVSENTPSVIQGYKEMFPNHRIVFCPPDDVANGIDFEGDDMPPIPRKAA